MSNSGALVVLALEEWRAGAAGVLECGGLAALDVMIPHRAIVM